jgi:secondary thiamine-phosphate synthase enzyme
MERGCHLITDMVVDRLTELRNYKIGLAHFFLQHSSASLCLNENYDSRVRLDMEDALNRLVPEHIAYRHSGEGKDDMVS